MRGIKGIAKILKCLAVHTLPPIVKPNGYQRQKSKALLNDLKFSSEKTELIVKPAQHLHIQYIHTYQLQNTVF